MRQLEIEISKKNILDLKTKMVAYCSGTVWEPLTLPFNLCKFRKSRYRRKIFRIKKQKCRTPFPASVFYRRLVALNLARSGNRDIEVKYFEPKNENGRILFKGTAYEPLHLPLTCVTPGNIDIKEKYFEKKN